MAVSATIIEAEILERIISPQKLDWSPEVARSMLNLKFDAASTRRIRQLLNKNNRGVISAEERLVLERYMRVGQLLDLLHAKSRFCLSQAQTASK
jgi:hypothetical protein